MDTIEIVAGGAVLFAVALLIGWGVVRATRFRRPPRSLTERPPTAWRALIEQNVPVTRALNMDESARLLDLVTQFVREKQFDGGGGLEITEEMKVIVAAQACLLILNLDAGCYPRVRSVVMYPGTFVPRVPTLDRQLYTGPIAHPAPLLGEHVRGVVVLSWESAGRDPTVPRDGQNVVLHEFAHELDREDGSVDGVPLLEAPSSTRAWARVLQQRFEELGRAAQQGEPDLLSAYGATNRAEFFAVATETFFEKPVELRQRYPDLYEELKGFYRQDPAARLSSG
ncbi:MAG: zinc-dependent peptidase [Gemmatimonadales bacterium]